MRVMPYKRRLFESFGHNAQASISFRFLGRSLTFKWIDGRWITTFGRSSTLNGSIRQLRPLFDSDGILIHNQCGVSQALSKLLKG
jgi:hypothetical protein